MRDPEKNIIQGVTSGGVAVPVTVEVTDGVAGLTVVSTDEDKTNQTVLADVTNGPDATYNYYLDMRTYHYCSLHLVLNCAAGTVTVTMDGTAEDAATGAAVTDWHDVTTSLFGVANLQAAAGAAADIWCIDTPCPFTWLRVQVVANTGAGTGDWTLHQKRSF